MAKYLKKRRLYEVAKKLVSEMPKISSCKYDFCQSEEVLTFEAAGESYKVTAVTGCWIHVQSNNKSKLYRLKNGKLEAEI